MSISLTDSEHDDQDEEGVHHGKYRSGDGRDHGLERLDAAEEANDAEGPHELHQPVRDVGDPKVDQRDADDEHVEPVPAAADEALEPIREDVEDELHREGEGEEHVYA